MVVCHTRFIIIIIRRRSEVFTLPPPLPSIPPLWPILIPRRRRRKKNTTTTTTTTTYTGGSIFVHSFNCSKKRKRERVGVVVCQLVFTDTNTINRGTKNKRQTRRRTKK